MYRFVDRELHDQSRGAKILLSAMRQWVEGASLGRCVCRPIFQTFKAGNVQGAAAPFHIALSIVCYHANEPVRFGMRGSRSVAEHEAILLACLQVAATRTPPDMMELARQLVRADRASVLAEALCAIAKIFAAVGLRIEVAEQGAESTGPHGPDA